MLSLKNLQAAARRRGLHLQRPSKASDGKFALMLNLDDGASGFGRKRNERAAFFEDLEEVRDELRARPVDQATNLRRYNARNERKAADTMPRAKGAFGRR
jgi:hypothetical protein